MQIESHPFKPFVPQNAIMLILGTFPPKSDKWSMDFFYPNWINDMWRIMGIIFYNDKEHFVVEGEKRFDVDKIKTFLDNHRIAMYDTAEKVCRLKDNASDKFLDVIEPIDIDAMLNKNESIRVIVTTGEKAASIMSEITDTELPKMGECTDVNYKGKNLKHYRMPSTSRAYPMNIQKKAEFYANMFGSNGMLL